MMRWFRRLFWFGALAGAGYCAYRVVARRRATSMTMPSSSSAFAPTSPPPRNEARVAAPKARWVAPNDGQCPTGYPIKVNEGSGIYHVPGGRFYARTAADRCYATAEDATADGYRPAKA